MPFGVPELLASDLSLRTSIAWDSVCRAVPGETILQLIRRYDDEWVPESAVQTVLIGTNDARDGTPLDVFEMLVQRMLTKLYVSDATFVWMELPLMVEGLGHFPYSAKQGNR